MSYYKKILGENVYLSPATFEDVEAYTKWMNDFNITDYTIYFKKVEKLYFKKIIN